MILSATYGKKTNKTRSKNGGATNANPLSGFLPFLWHKLFPVLNCNVKTTFNDLSSWSKIDRYRLFYRERCPT